MKKVDSTQPQSETTASQYRGLPSLLHGVRWTQHLLSIVAEVLILLSFAMSGMDVSLGGVMTRVTWLTWAWGAAFALGIDTSFVIAWVRVRQCVVARMWGAFTWNIILALGMSFIVFEPVAIQMLQQSLSISFTQSLNQLGINLVILVYARASVAVLLGAILAMTNVESAMKDTPVPARSQRRLIIFERVLNRIAPVVGDIPEQLPAQSEQVVITQIPEQLPAQVIKQIEAKHPTPLSIVPVSDELTPVERVKQVLENNPDCSDRELGRLTKLAPATAKKHRSQVTQEQERVG